ncbi:MAG: RloB family protein [Microcoleaceae cyanobacterium]
MNPKSSKNNNRRKSRAYKNRTVNSRDKIQRFLIVCEGSKTEPNYFKHFRVPKNVVELDIRGIGENTVNLVKEAIKLKEDDGDYDQVWCVFDKNSFSKEQFNQALDIAKKNNIKVAYSNEAFEIWYILHFDYRDTAMSRKEYQKELTEKLIKANLIKKNQQYQKNDSNMYEYLERLQLQAIKNAKKLLEQYNPPQPAIDNPSTTVHLLVEELNKFARP